MTFNKHQDLEGAHALLGPSKHYWISYDAEKLENFYKRVSANIRGTELHKFAADCIRLKQKLPRSGKTLNMYVNDAIGFKMTPEQVLYYSQNCFGTADAISFKHSELRIHDLKTGVAPARMEQLLIYAGLFFLEYKVKPVNVSTVLRIYQNNEIIEQTLTAEELEWVMDRIVTSDKFIKELKAQEG